MLLLLLLQQCNCNNVIDIVITFPLAKQSRAKTKVAEDAENREDDRNRNLIGDNDKEDGGDGGDGGE